MQVNPQIISNLRSVFLKATAMEEQLLTITSIIGVGVSLLLMFFFVGMKAAFLSANRLNIELRRNQRTEEGILMGKYVDNKNTFLSTCYFGITFATIVYAFFFNELMKAGIWHPIHFDNTYISLTLDVVLASIPCVFFGKFLAETIFNRNDRLLYALLFFFNGFHKIIYPITTAFQNFANGILKYLFNVRITANKKPFDTVNADPRNHHRNDESHHSSNENDINTVLFENALFLSSLKIRQCLTPRTEVISIDVKTGIDDARKKLIDSRLNKIVVYEDNIDNILGYALMIDFFKNPPDLRSILLPVFIVPETQSVTDLLHRFSKERKSIAWVVDEFGGTAGIVTIDNIIRELFGETQDQYGNEQYVAQHIAENEFLLSGRIELARLNERFDFDFPEKDFETLSGYIIREHKKIPKEKERVFIGDYVFDIISVTDTRIDLVKLKILR